jgi:hypothetical protein
LSVEVLGISDGGNSDEEAAIETNQDYAMASFLEAGYEVRYTELDSMRDAGMPERRGRYYYFGLSVEKYAAMSAARGHPIPENEKRAVVHKVVDRMGHLIDRFRMKAPDVDLDKFLLAETDPLLIKCLQNLTAPTPKCDKLVIWKKMHAVYFDSHGLEFSEKIFDSFCYGNKNASYNTLTQRERSVLNYFDLHDKLPLGDVEQTVDVSPLLHYVRGSLLVPTSRFCSPLFSARFVAYLCWIFHCTSELFV